MHTVTILILAGVCLTRGAGYGDYLHNGFTETGHSQYTGQGRIPLLWMDRWLSLFIILLLLERPSHVRKWQLLKIHVQI